VHFLSEPEPPVPDIFLPTLFQWNTLAALQTLLFFFHFPGNLLQKITEIKSFFQNPAKIHSIGFAKAVKNVICTGKVIFRFYQHQAKGERLLWHAP
jgi:hypothetical protein